MKNNLPPGEPILAAEHRRQFTGCLTAKTEGKKLKTNPMLNWAK
jgi:hypothetical protein